MNVACTFAAIVRQMRPIGVGLGLAAVVTLLAVAAGNSDAVIARVGDRTITAGSFAEEIERRGGSLPGQYDAAEHRRALLDEMIEFQALVAQATAEGYDRHPDVTAAFQRILVATFKEDRLEPRLNEITVADHEILSFYERHKQDYAVPERYRAAIVLIGVPLGVTDEQRAAQQEKAERALEEARALEPSIRHFGPVAAEYSNDRASRYRGGVIGWLTRDATHEYRWAPEVVEAVFALQEPGEIAPIVSTDHGFYLVRLVDREARQVRPLEALRDGFRYQIRRDKETVIREEFIRQILSGMTVSVDDAVLDSVEPPDPTLARPAAKQPPDLPSG